MNGLIISLQEVPEIVLTGLQHSSNEAGQIPAGEYTARFSQFSYEKDGETRTSPSVAIVEDGQEKQLGALSARSMHLPLGTTVKADIEIAESGKTARMQIHDLAPEPPANLIEFPSPTASQTAATGTAGMPMAAESPGVYNADRSPEAYTPSRQELRQWCAVAIASGDEPLTAEIMTKGKQLNALYTQETGSSEKPPLAYRHPNLVIGESDRQQMRQDIGSGQQALQAVTHRPLPKAAAEMTQ